MTSSISGTASSQQYFLQVTQNNSQTGNGANAANNSAASQPAGTPPSGAPSATSPSGDGGGATAGSGSGSSKSTESASTRNADGTYGPHHTIFPPQNSSATQSSQSVAGSVDITV